VERRECIRVEFVRAYQEPSKPTICHISMMDA
jgi:hypothetical protein